MICGFTRGTAFSSVCKEPASITCGNKCWQHCDVGQAFNNKLLQLHNKRLTDWQMNNAYMDIMNEWLEHGIEAHGLQDNREKKTRNGKYNGPFAFTLTMSPSDGLTVDEMMYACRKIMEQKSQPVKKFAWYLEYKDEELKTHPHIHGMYETDNGRRIERKHWMRNWKIWDESIPLGSGFRGGYHRPVRADEAYSKYIAKQGGIGDSGGV